MSEQTCAVEVCDEPRITANRGTESYCRQHKNEIARAVRHSGREPEVIEVIECARPSCIERFELSSWSTPRRFCSTKCRELEPKERRALAREEKRHAREREWATFTERHCGTCGESRPREEWYFVKGRPARCKSCQREAQTASDARRPGASREQKRDFARRKRLAQHLYYDDCLREWRPMTPDDFERELGFLANSCAVCHQPFGDARPDVDHDHVSGTFRGILCRSCNIRLHKSATVDWFESAGMYLIQHAALLSSTPALSDT